MNRSGKNITLSQVYLILNSPFYYGEFEWPEKSGNWYKGAHEPLITKELFDQIHLGRVDYKGRYGSKSFTFKGLLTCGKRESSITAEEKFKLLKDGTYNRHVYYSCAKGKNRNCDQKDINETKLIEQFSKYIRSNSDVSLSNELTRTITTHHRIVMYHLGTRGIETDSIRPLTSYTEYVIASSNHRLMRDLLERMGVKFILNRGQII